MIRIRFALLTLVLAAAACGGDDEGTPQDSASADAARSADSASFDAADEASVARGAYVVEHVAACGDCHTPFGEAGPDLTMFLAGNDCFFDVDQKSDAAGCLATPNLTNHATGLMNRTDAEIRAMFQDGVRPDGSALFDPMPYWAFHNMTDVDARSVVLYLRSVTGIDHTVAGNQPPFDVRPPAPTRPLADAELPAAPAGNAGAANGRYLSQFSCIDCHTRPTAPGSAFPLDLTMLFAGGREFPGAAFGPPGLFPDVIYTFNLTPHATGIMGRTAAQIRDELLLGVDPAGDAICPPMPVGPNGPFGGLTESDATDIGTYLLSLPPIDNALANDCQAPSGGPPAMTSPGPTISPGQMRARRASAQ